MATTETEFALPSEGKTESMLGPPATTETAAWPHPRCLHAHVAQSRRHQTATFSHLAPLRKFRGQELGLWRKPAQCAA